MSNYSQEEISYFWKEGKNLWDALCAFCDREIWKEYPQGITKKDGSSVPSVMGIITQLAEVGEYQSKIDAAVNKLKADLYHRIRREELIAVGAKIAAELPSYIPLHMWPPKEINLRDSSISGKGFEFFEVRIIAKTNLPKLTAPQKLIAPVITPLPKLAIKDKTVGRPTHRDKIITAYQLLKKNGHLDYSKTLKAHTEIIQKTVLHLFHEIKTIDGMEYEAIRRIVMPLFKEDKKTSKPTSKL